MRGVLAELPIKEYSYCAFSEVEDRLLECAAKKRLPENAKTVIIFLFPYKVRSECPEKISRFAAVPDYHEVLGKYLNEAANRLKLEFPENEFSPFCDNSPIPEVFAASTAGLGLAGDNGLLITRKYGSFVFLGEIVTDLELPCYSEYMGCTHCKHCKVACPVDLCKEKCLSKLSQKKGELLPEEKNMLKRHGIVWGCDICGEVCPFNRYAQYTYIPEFESGYRNCYKKGENPEGRAYAWRGKTIERNIMI